MTYITELIQPLWDRFQVTGKEQLNFITIIVGGTVDYGAAHAKKYGIKRFGHTYHGIYPSVSDENKIHLVGHSMGGHSIRQLENFFT
jgi:triacylglycerol esterase/lipase EstA (alpha/beta hydrolase family)